MAQQFRAARRVRDFRMELHAVPAARIVGHRGDRQIIRGRRRHETRRNGGDAIAVRHPHVELATVRAESLPQFVLARQRDARRAEFARVPAFGFAAELRGHRLHAVADAEDRHAAVVHRLRRARRIFFRRRLRPAGQDDSLRREFGDRGRIVIPRPDFAVDADLADAPRDQLRVLRAEIEDQDFVAVDVGHFIGRIMMWLPPARTRARDEFLQQTD